MATRKTVDKIQIKRGSGTTLSDNQKGTVLAEGEPFYHKGAGFVTIGNGNSSINTLPKIGTKEKIEIIGANNKSSVSIGTYSHVTVGTGSNLSVGNGADVSVGSNVPITIEGSLTLGSYGSMNISSPVDISMPISASNSYAIPVVNVGSQNVGNGSVGILGTALSGSVSIGVGCSAKNNSVAVGSGAQSDNSATAIGANASAEAENAIAFGVDSRSNSNYAVAIGDSSACARGGSIAIGKLATVSNITSDANENAVAIGRESKAMSGSSIALGVLSRAGGTDDTTKDGNSCISIGESASSNGDNAIAIGSGARASGFGAIAIGNGVVAEGAGSISIGDGSSRIELGNNKFLIGGNQSYISAGNYSNPSFSAGALLPGIKKSLIDIDEQSVSIGTYADVNGGSNCIAIGYNAKVPQVLDVGSDTRHPASNTVQLLDRSIWKGLAMYVGTKTVNLVDSSTSDARLKQNVTDADTAICLADVNRLKVSRFEYKPFVEGIVDKHRTGWMADDVEKVFKNAVYRRDDTFPVLDENGEKVYEEVELNDGTKQKVEKRFAIKDVQHIEMGTIGLPTLWGAVQELSKLMTATQERVTELETAVKTLKKENTLLKNKLKELDTSTKEEPSIEE